MVDGALIFVFLLLLAATGARGGFPLTAPRGATIVLLVMKEGRDTRREKRNSSRSVIGCVRSDFVRLWKSTQLDFNHLNFSPKKISEVGFRREQNHSLIVPHGNSTSSRCFVRAFYLFLQNFLTSHVRGGGNYREFSSSLYGESRKSLPLGLEEVKILPPAQNIQNSQKYQFRTWRGTSHPSTLTGQEYGTPHTTHHLLQP